MKRLNVLVSSSRQWNPGDEFIRFGVQNLLRSVIRAPMNWLMWNRNPDLFVKRWEDAHMRTDFLTNSLREPCLDVMDLVVFAGTPEWTGSSVERIYRELLKYPELPVLVLGVGSGASGFRLQPHEMEVLRRPNVLLTTRSTELAEELNAILGVAKAFALPCPAGLCAPTVSSAPRDRVGLILQSSSVVNQWIDETLVQQALAALAGYSGPKVEIVSLYVDEFMRFSRVLPQHPQVYFEEPTEYLATLAGYRAVVSTRLHGAIAALSTGTPTVLVAKDNFRLETAQRLYDSVLPSRPIGEAVRWMSSLTDADANSQHRAITAFKSRLYEEYRRRVRGFLGDFIPAVVA